MGVDAFGPWSEEKHVVVWLKARDGPLLFSCLSSRAVHIEVIDEMSTSTFVYALRRFEAIRGPVRELKLYLDL